MVQQQKQQPLKKNVQWVAVNLSRDHKPTIPEEAEIIKEEIKQKINKIDKKQFMALRSYRQPPKEIVTMMRAICIIMSNFEKKPLETVPTQWDYYKKKLNDVSLLKTLQSLPKKLESTQFSPKIVELLTPYINDRDIEPSYM